MQWLPGYLDSESCGVKALWFWLGRTHRASIRIVLESLVDPRLSGTLEYVVPPKDGEVAKLSSRRGRFKDLLCDARHSITR